MDDTRACALLARVPGLTAQRLRAAAAQLGSLPAVASCPDALDAAPDGGPPLSAAAWAFLREPPQALIDADIRWLARNGAALVPCTSPHFPPRLAELPDAPPALYVLGDPSALCAEQIAMVGARRATATGLDIARELARGLASAGLAVTSGLALGIDGASHEGALAVNGRTFAVCAHGLDRIYPRRHGELALRIRERGALISPFPPGTPPRRERFPQRNRILSGLALATLVVEAARESGSLITARAARQQGRPVFAVPGSIRNPLAEGCLELIREGARLVQSAASVLQDLGFHILDQGLTEPQGEHPAAADTATPLDKDSEILLDALGFEPVSLDTLAERTGLAPGSMASILLDLELRGRVTPHPGGRYCRLT